MAAYVIRTVGDRHDLDPEAIDGVILGCLDNIGSQAGDIARTAALAAGLPESVPGVTVRGADRVILLRAPILATRHALKWAGLSIDDIDLVEIDEAFAPVVLAWLGELDPDPERVNVNGGAIALGYPIGCTGARLMTSLLHELERTGGRYGLQSMCEGAGQANVTIIERL
jgi:acetyl-CoA acetyltransferase